MKTAFFTLSFLWCVISIWNLCHLIPHKCYIGMSLCLHELYVCVLSNLWHSKVLQLVIFFNMVILFGREVELWATHRTWKRLFFPLAFLWCVISIWNLWQMIPCKNHTGMALCLHELYLCVLSNLWHSKVFQLVIFFNMVFYRGRETELWATHSTWKWHFSPLHSIDV